MQYLSFLFCLALSFAVQAETFVAAKPFKTLVIYPKLDVPAQVAALNQPQVSAEMIGTITKIQPKVGDWVNQGDLLVELDCRENQTRLAQAKAELSRMIADRRFAANQLRRAENLQAKQSISDELFDQRKNDLAHAQAQIAVQNAAIESAQLQVEHCRILAPMKAVVTKRMASVGGMAMQGTPLIALVELENAEVSASLRTAEVQSIKKASSIQFIVENKAYPLKWRTLLPVFDVTQRTQEARFTFVDQTAAIGSAGRLAWQDAQKHIPSDYLVRRKNQLGIFLLQDAKAQFYPLPKAIEGQAAAVEIADDALVITEGREAVQNNQVVKRLTQTVEN